MDTDNTQAVRCPALRLYVVRVVLSFFISLLNSLSCRSHIIFFFFFLLHCIFQVLITFLELWGPNWLDIVAQNKKELVLHYLTQPGLFFSELCCSELKRHLCSKKEVKIYVSCQRKKMSREKSRVLCTGRGVCLSLWLRPPFTQVFPRQSWFPVIVSE